MLPDSEQRRLDAYFGNMVLDAWEYDGISPRVMFDSSRPQDKTLVRDRVVWELRLIRQNRPSQPTEVVIPGDGKAFGSSWSRLSFPRIGQLLNLTGHSGAVRMYQRECRRRADKVGPLATDEEHWWTFRGLLVDVVDRVPHRLANARISFADPCLQYCGPRFSGHHATQRVRGGLADR